MLQGELSNQQELVLSFQATVKTLGALCVTGDQEFVQDNFEFVHTTAEDVTSQTDDR